MPASVFIGDAARRGDEAAAPAVRSGPIVAYGPAELLAACYLNGCDDYLKEPWSPAELEWRALRLLGRAAENWRFGWGRLEIRGLALHGPAASCPLSEAEARILRLLVANRGEAVPRQALYYAIWGRPGAGVSRVVDVHVCSLRKKLRRLLPASAGSAPSIRSVRGVGYRIV